MNYQERHEFLRRLVGASEDDYIFVLDPQFLAGEPPEIYHPVELIGGMAYLSNRHGKIVSHDEYERVKALLDEFYARVHPDEITSFNQEESQPRVSQFTERTGSVYVLKYKDRYKIGITYQNVETRRRQVEGELQRHFDRNASVEIIAVYASNKPRTVEELLHAEFSSKRLEGEWFALTQSDLQEINTLVEQSQ